MTITVPVSALALGKEGWVARYSVSRGITSKLPVLKPSSAGGFGMGSGGTLGVSAVGAGVGAGVAEWPFLKEAHPTSTQAQATAARVVGRIIIGVARTGSWDWQEWADTGKQSVLRGYVQGGILMWSQSCGGTGMDGGSRWSQGR